MAALPWTKLLAPFSQQHLLASWLCATLWHFLQYLKLFHYYGDLRSVGASQVALVVKNSLAKAEDRDTGSIPGSGRSPGGGRGNPLQCSMDRGALRVTVHGVSKSWTWLKRLSTARHMMNFNCHFKNCKEKKTRNIAMGHVLLHCWNDHWIRYIFID